MNAFKKEIIAVLLIKIALIYGLWWAFFSTPMDKDLTDIDVSTAFLGNQSPLLEKSEKKEIARD